MKEYKWCTKKPLFKTTLIDPIKMGDQVWSQFHGTKLCEPLKIESATNQQNGGTLEMAPDLRPVQKGSHKLLLMLLKVLSPRNSSTCRNVLDL